MTRRMISAVLALMICMSLVVCVSAEPKTIDFVIDEFGNLTDTELMELNDLAVKAYETTGVGIFFAYVDADSLEDYDLEWITGGMTDYVIMMENDEYWYLHRGGLGEYIDDDTKYALRDIYDATPTYVEGVEQYLMAAAECFPNVGDVPTEEAHTEPAVTPTEEIEESVTEDTTTIGSVAETFLIDDADLLSDIEEATLRQKLEDISHTYNAQLVIVTVPSVDGGDVEAYTDFLYDSAGFGYGEEKDGVLLLICMDPREYQVLSNGYAGAAIGPDQIDMICGIMANYLPDGHYSAAFIGFADRCETYLDRYVNGYPFQAGKSLLISLVIGIVVGLVVALILKAQLKSVRKQYRAHDYVKTGSMQVDVRHDIFLYRTVTREKKSSDSDASGSRSRSSGGSARSRGGGSF